FDTEDLRELAHVRAPRAAVHAHAARDVALGGDVIPDLRLADERAGLDDRAAELVAERERRFDPALRPVVPPVGVKVGAADARRLDANKDLVGGYRRNRNLDEVEPRLGT